MESENEKLFAEYTSMWGARPSWLRLHKRIDWELSTFALRKAIGGGRVMSPRYAFFRCQACHSLVTNRGLVKRNSCKCGGGQYIAVDKVNLRQVAKALLLDN